MKEGGSDTSRELKGVKEKLFIHEMYKVYHIRFWKNYSESFQEQLEARFLKQTKSEKGPRIKGVQNSFQSSILQSQIKKVQTSNRSGISILNELTEYQEEENILVHRSTIVGEKEQVKEEKRASQIRVKATQKNTSRQFQEEPYKNPIMMKKKQKNQEKQVKDSTIILDKIQKQLVQEQKKGDNSDVVVRNQQKKVHIKQQKIQEKEMADKVVGILKENDKLREGQKEEDQQEQEQEVGNSFYDLTQKRGNKSEIADINKQILLNSKSQIISHNILHSQMTQKSETINNPSKDAPKDLQIQNEVVLQKAQLQEEKNLQVNLSTQKVEDNFVQNQQTESKQNQQFIISINQQDSSEISHKQKINPIKEQSNHQEKNLDILTDNLLNDATDESQVLLLKQQKEEINQIQAEIELKIKDLKQQQNQSERRLVLSSNNQLQIREAAENITDRQARDKNNQTVVADGDLKIDKQVQQVEEYQNQNSQQHLRYRDDEQKQELVGADLIIADLINQIQRSKLPCEYCKMKQIYQIRTIDNIRADLEQERSYFKEELDEKDKIIEQLKMQIQELKNRNRILEQNQKQRQLQSFHKINETVDAQFETEKQEGKINRQEEKSRIGSRKNILNQLNSSIRNKSKDSRKSGNSQGSYQSRKNSSQEDEK